MYKLVILPLLFAAVSAGYLGAPAVTTYAAAPVVAHAPVVAAPAAVSYANTYRAPPARLAVAAAPVAVAAPAVAAYAAPAYVSSHVAAPLAYGLH